MSAVAVLLLIFSNVPSEASITAVAAILGFFYFVQQQRLEETRLFKELFLEFNKRYDRLNGFLMKITTDPNLQSETLRVKFIDYFNLCAEEFLFYKRGYIYPEVWQAWCRGMLQYLSLPGVRALWNSETQTGSYYGLTYTAIEFGAG